MDPVAHFHFDNPILEAKPSRPAQDGHPFVLGLIVPEPRRRGLTERYDALDRTAGVSRSVSSCSAARSGGISAKRFMAVWFLDTVLEFDGAQEPMQEEGRYICTSCGEEIVVPIDLSAGESQEYTEDCPVCCHPNVIRIEVSENGDIRAWADRESD